MTQHALISRCEVTKNILQHQIFFDVFNYLVNENKVPVPTVFHVNSGRSVSRFGKHLCKTGTWYLVSGENITKQSTRYAT